MKYYKRPGERAEGQPLLEARAAGFLRRVRRCQAPLSMAVCYQPLAQSLPPPRWNARLWLNYTCDEVRAWAATATSAHAFCGLRSCLSVGERLVGCESITIIMRVTAGLAALLLTVTGVVSADKPSTSTPSSSSCGPDTRLQGCSSSAKPKYCSYAGEVNCCDIRQDPQMTSPYCRCADVCHPHRVYYHLVRI